MKYVEDKKLHGTKQNQAQLNRHAKGKKYM
jgi:hypothetical protein